MENPFNGRLIRHSSNFILIALLVLAGLAGSAQNGRADDDCIPRVLQTALGYYSSETRISLPELVPASFGSVEKEVLKHHPIRRFAAGLSGKQIAFQSLFFDSGMISVYKGETIQAGYVKTVLKKLFPGAKFVKDAKGAGSRTVYPIVLSDVAEHPDAFAGGIKGVLQTGEALPMHIIKPVGSRKEVPLPKEEIRRKLGFSPEQKVVSLYIRAGDTLFDADPRVAYPMSKYEELFSSLKSGFNYDAVILTFGNLVRSGLPPETIAFRYLNNAKTVKLTDILQGRAGPIKKGTLIRNDTYGMVPYLHAAADLAVVVGPINFFEPIYAGTKTVLVKTTGSLYRNSDYGHYDREILDQMATLAEGTGALVSVDTVEQVGTGARTILRKSKAIDTEQIRKQTFTAFLDQLLKHLENRKPDGLSALK